MRELFNQYNERLTENDEQELFELGLKKYKDQQIESPEFKNFLASVDYSTLEQIFLQYAKKSGLENINLPGKEKVFALSGDNADAPIYGEYDAAHDFILIYYDNVKKKIDRYDAPEEIWLTKILIHELGHSVSKITCTGLEGLLSAEDAALDHDITVELGLSKVRISPGEEGKVEFLYMLLEEGVNDKLADEILEKYISTRSEDEKRKFIEYKENLKQNKSLNGYRKCVKFVNLLIKEFAARTGSEVQTVWEAMVRARFEKNTFFRYRIHC